MRKLDASFLQNLTRPKVLLVLLVLLFGAFLRLHRLADTLQFQGDQGRDALVVQRMVKEGDLVFIGPVTSVGNLYLGPFYYYFMAPWLWLTYPSPIGPAYAVALVNITSLALLYFLAKDMFGYKAAVITTLINAVMLPAVLYSRFSWNPNIMPLFSLGILFCLRQAGIAGRYRYLSLAWLLFGLLIQLHYMALVLSGVIVLISGYLFLRRTNDRRVILLASLVGLVLFGLTLVPQIAFDFKNNHLLSQGFTTFFTGDEQHVRLLTKVGKFVSGIEGKLIHLLAQLGQSPSRELDRVVVFGSLAAAFLVAVTKRFARVRRFDLLLLGLFLLMTVVGTSFFTSSVHDHYLTFIFPFIALFSGLVLGKIAKLHRLAGVLVALLLVGFIHQNMADTPALTAESKPLSRFERLFEQVRPYLSSDTYNIALNSNEREYKALNYRYYFEVSGHPPVGLDDYDNIHQLIVVNERSEIDPTSLDPYEFNVARRGELIRVLPGDNNPDVYIYEQE